MEIEKAIRATCDFGKSIKWMKMERKLKSKMKHQTSMSCKWIFIPGRSNKQTYFWKREEQVRLPKPAAIPENVFKSFDFFIYLRNICFFYFLTCLHLSCEVKCCKVMLIVVTCYELAWIIVFCCKTVIKCDKLFEPSLTLLIFS